MILRWLARFWHWLTEAEPWNRHAPRHDPPPRTDRRNGLDWPDDD